MKFRTNNIGSKTAALFFKEKAAAVTAVFCAVFLLTSMQAFAITFYDLTLSSDGDATWSVSADSDEVVDYYQLQLARNKDGTWDEDYKTVRSTDTSYDFTFSTKGQYYFVVRAKLIGGDYTDWSDASNYVYITSDDVESSPSTTNSYYGNSNYGPGTGNYGNSYTVYNSVTGEYYSTSGSSIGASATATGTTGWISDAKGYRYWYSNGTYAVNTMLQLDGAWYYFDTDGYMVTGWLYYNGYWYYFLTSGKMAVSSWNNINEKWYYFNDAGIMQTGYIILDGKTYYTDSSGARVESAYNPDGHLFDLNGVMVE